MIITYSELKKRGTKVKHSLKTALKEQTPWPRNEAMTVQKTYSELKSFDGYGFGKITGFVDIATVVKGNII